VLASIEETLADFHAANFDAGEGADVVYVEEGAENTFRVYAREGEPCPRCRRPRGPKAAIERVVLAGRSSFFCPRCQG
jgi:formamidopyrimidine-DNA glycosylase